MKQAHQQRNQTSPNIQDNNNSNQKATQTLTTKQSSMNLAD